MEGSAPKSFTHTFSFHYYATLLRLEIPFIIHHSMRKKKEESPLPASVALPTGETE
jgi:hypothetical protein